MKEKQIKKVEKELKKLGCGHVELGDDFEIEKVEGDWFSKDLIRYSEGKEGNAFVVVAKSPHGSFVGGRDESAQFLKFFIDLWKIVFSTLFNKTTFKFLVKAFRILQKKKR